MYVFFYLETDGSVFPSNGGPSEKFGVATAYPFYVARCHRTPSGQVGPT